MDDHEILAALTRIDERLSAGGERMGEIAFAGKETARAAREICDRLGVTVKRVDAIELARQVEAQATAMKAAEERGRASVGAVLTKRQLAGLAGLVTLAVAVGGFVLRVLEQW